jgi:hypothetical protein
MQSLRLNEDGKHAHAKAASRKNSRVVVVIHASGVLRIKQSVPTRR